MAIAQAPAVNDQKKEKDQEAERICLSLRKRLEQEKDIRKVVKNVLQLGYSPCSVIDCAHRIPEDDSEIITGAIEACLAPDVIARCALDAGIDGNLVAELLEEAREPELTLLLPERPDMIVQPKITFLSPSGF